MLYLEDYLEMIEHLPQELRDRFTEMRELDLTVQNNMDSLEKKTRNFFQQCKRGELLHDSADSEFHHLRKEYYKVMEDADEKVAIATQIHELVERYLRRLDSELFKFKCELEADNNGITEILEKRSLELDGHNNTTPTSLLMSLNQKENRYYGTQSLISSSPVVTANSSAGILSSVIASVGSSVGTNSAVGVSSTSVGVGAGISSNSTSGNASSSISGGSSNLTNIGIGNSVASGSCVVNTSNSIVCLGSVHTPPPRQRKLERRRETICTMTVPEKRPNLNHSLPSSHITTTSSHTITPLRPLTTSLVPHPGLSTGNPGTPVPTPTAVTYNLQQLGGAASSAIAAAASQAIVATQQMQQGRRTASLKASYEAIHGGAGVGVGPTEFWIANAANNTTAVTAHNTTTLPTNNATPSGHHHHHHHHHEKKQKKKLNHHHHSMTVTSNVAISNPTASSSVPSITSSSSSSLSADSLEIVPVAPGISAVITSAPGVTVSISTNNVPITGITSTLGHNAAAAVNVNTISNPVVMTSPVVNTLPSTAVAPGANMTINENGLVVEQTTEGEWSYDPNEPRYCTCNQVSYGDMVACDNDACPYEWFHYPCVGITQPPKGKWYCPKCTASMRRRGNRKN